MFTPLTRLKICAGSPAAGQNANAGGPLETHETAAESVTREVLGATIVRVWAWLSAVATPPGVSGTETMFPEMPEPAAETVTVAEPAAVTPVRSM